MKKLLNLTSVFFLLFSINMFAQDEIESAKFQLLDKKKSELTDNQILSKRDVDEMRISSAYQSPSTGWYHIYFNQRYKEIEVYNAQLNVVLKNKTLVHLNTQFVPKIEKMNLNAQPTINPAQAVQLVLNHLGLQPFQTEFLNSELLSNNTIAKATFQNPSSSENPIKVQLYWLPNADKTAVQLVWNVNIEVPSTSDWWNVRINAQTGEFIEQNNWVAHCNFDKPNGHCEHQKEQLNQNQAPLLPIVANSYNVFDIPLESPSFGSRSIVTNPYTRFVPAGTGPGATNGWHDDGTNSFTHTQGNNVLAQDDLDNSNTTVGSRPSSSTLDFDFPYTFGPGTSPENLNSAITNLFYWNNLIHDILYKYGFDEVGGNFQANNLSRGGLGNDFVNADAQDAGGVNNANFSTPVDGTNGRMQMYLWTGTTFTINSPSNIAGNYTAVESGFSINNKLKFNITGNLILVNDNGTATTALGCLVPFDNAASIVGKIAVIDRGSTCSYATKVKNAQNAGAIACIVINNTSTAPTTFIMTGSDNSVTIPAFFVSLTTGNAIKTQLNAGQTVTVTLATRTYQPDGDFDNGVITHEYGHGWSNRLTGGPANSSCLSNTEQMGEGWSDFLSLMFTTNWAALTPTTASANLPRGIGTYVIGQAATGGGIRPFPYSYNKASVNPNVTYSGVGNSTTFSQPHGIGSIWCTILWDMAWEIIFQDNQIVNDISNTSNLVGNAAALKLVNEGLRLQKCSPSFVDGRDAILKADELLFNSKYKCAIWKAFARRGVGANASTGTSSSDRVVTEDFTLPSGVTISKTSNVSSAPEGSNVTYSLTATCGCSPLTTTITDILPSSLTYVPNSANNSGTLVGNNVTWANQTFAVKETKTYTFQANIGNVYQAASMPLNDNFDGSTPSGSWANSALTGTLNFASSTTFSNSAPNALFAPNSTTAVTDFVSTSGVSYNLTGPALLTFSHRFNTEADWDGGVVEISINNGTTWTDLGPYFTTYGYNGTIGAAGRNGFSGNSNGWKQSVINLQAFCGTTAKIRFRMFSDDNTDCGSAGNCGWYIDDVSLSIPSGIKNTANTATGSSAANCIEVTQGISYPKLTAKVYLDNYNATTGLMDDYLKSEPNFPKIDPYSSTFSSSFMHFNSFALDSTTATVLATTGNNSIVDWVFLELRTGVSGATSVVTTKAALLQKDGDIVDMDGISAVSFVNVPSGAYYVTVRHRNHLGFRTLNTVTLTPTTPLLNFTDNSVPLYGVTPTFLVSANINAMNGGDSNSDGSIDSVDSGIWESQNGSFDDYLLNGDYNLDGSVDGVDSAIWEMNNGKYQELD